MHGLDYDIVLNILKLLYSNSTIFFKCKNWVCLSDIYVRKKIIECLPTCLNNDSFEMKDKEMFGGNHVAMMSVCRW